MDGIPVDLTSREQEVFKLVAEGLSFAQTGRILGISEGTVKSTLSQVRRKLGAQTTTHAVLIAERYYRHLLKGAIAKHGTRGARASHLRYGTPLCGPCSFLDTDHRQPTVMVPASRKQPSSGRLRPSDPARCGTLPAVRRHINAREKVSLLTCGCREAYAEWFREYRRNGGGSLAA